MGGVSHQRHNIIAYLAHTRPNSGVVSRVYAPFCSRLVEICALHRGGPAARACTRIPMSIVDGAKLS